VAKENAWCNYTLQKLRERKRSMKVKKKKKKGEANAGERQV
jgi:hypothetical protein